MDHQPEVRPELALGNRYIAAWGEINARIQGRDNIILTFVIVAVAIIGAALSSDNPVLALYLPLAVPWMALILTQLWTAHDLLIGLLSRHLGDVARDSGPIKVWDWHTGDRYLVQILLRRSFMYGAHVLAVWLLCVLALYTSNELSKRIQEPVPSTTLNLQLPKVVISRTQVERKGVAKVEDTLSAVPDTATVSLVKHEQVRELPREWRQVWWLSVFVGGVAAVQTLIIFYLRIRGVRKAAEGHSRIIRTWPNA